MFEISIYTKENETDCSYTKKIIDGVNNIETCLKLMPEPIKETFVIWSKCRLYRDKDEGLLKSMQIIFDDVRYIFNDWYWD